MDKLNAKLDRWIRAILVIIIMQIGFLIGYTITK